MPSSTETKITFVCDNPDCKFGKQAPTVLQWISEEVQSDATKLPPRAWRIIRVTLFNTNTFQFCGIDCARWWLAHIDPLDPPALKEPVADISQHPDFMFGEAEEGEA